MNTVYLSLGSNVHPEQHIPAALEFLKQTFQIKKISSTYETSPIGPAGSQNFWNAAAAIQTDDTKEALVLKLRRIEEIMGRVRSENKFAPRTIDIDILPQPDYQKHAFIMIPLAEIAPEEKDPETGKSFGELAETLKEEAENFIRVLPGS